MNLEPNEEIVYSSDGSFWKVVGNSNLAIALLILFVLFGFDFFVEDMIYSPLFIPLVLLEIALPIFWFVTVYKQMKLTSLFITNQRVVYYQPGFGKNNPIHSLPYESIQAVRIASGIATLVLKDGKPIRLEYVGNHKKVSELIQSQLTAHQK